MLIFNEAQALAYSTNFNYVGESFNYNNSSTINIKGRLQSDRAFDSSSGGYFGLAYVDNDNNIYYNGDPLLYNGTGLVYGDTGWVPFGSTSGALTTGSVSEMYGHLFFEGGYAFVRSPSTGTVFSGNSTGNDYSPLYDIWAGMDEVREKFSDFQEIYLNGVSIGSGRVTRISFPKSLDPRTSTYETEIQLYKSGNLYNLSGAGFNSIQIDNTFCKYVKNLDEGFVMSTDKEGVISYDRSLSFDAINPEMVDSAFLSGVKTFASGIIFNDPSFQASLNRYPSFYEREGSRLFSESYDVVQGSFSFSEKFQGPSLGQKYKWTNSLSVSMQNDGTSSVSEKGSVQGVRESFIDSAYEGVELAQASSAARVSEFYGAYTGGFGVCADSFFLKANNKTINKEAGLIEYSFEYSNDPFSTGSFNVTRELQFSRSDGGEYTLSEQGSVASLGSSSNSERLNQAVAHFKANISGGIPTRIYNLYSSASDGCGCLGGAVNSNDIRKVSSDLAYSDFNGLFNYNFVYKNECSSLVEGVFSTTFEKDTSSSVHNVFAGVTPYEGEVVQPQNKATLVSQKQTISVTSLDGTKGLEDYVAIAIGKIQTPSTDTFFMDSADYSFDPDNSKLTMNIQYNTNGYREYSNYNV